MVGPQDMNLQPIGHEPAALSIELSTITFLRTAEPIDQSRGGFPEISQISHNERPVGSAGRTQRL